MLKPSLSRYLLIGFIVVMMFGSIGIQAFMIGLSGGAAALPELFFVAATFLTLITAISTSSKQLFGFRDLDTQLSWPFSARTIVASRVLIFYVSELAFSALLLIPAFAVYAYFLVPEWWFYAVALLLMLVTPVIPSIIGSILGSLLAIVTAKSRFGKAIEFAGLTLIVAAAIALNFILNRANVGGEDAFLSAAESLKNTPAVLFSNALNGKPSSLLLLIGGSAALFALFSLALGKVFFAVNSAITSKRTNANYTLGTVKQSGAFTALIAKELKMYFGSTIYVFNTLFGVILALAVAIAVAVLGVDKIFVYFGVSESELAALNITNVQIGYFIPFALAFFAAMSPTTSATISIEGRRLETLVALPVHTSRIYGAKRLVNYIVYIPPMIIAGILLAVRLPSEYTLFYFLIPLIYILLSAEIGLGVNLLLPKLNWTTETQVVKQSAAVVVTVFANMIICCLPIVLFLILGLDIGDEKFLTLSFCIPALITMVIAYVLNFGAGKNRLRDLL
jgi:ABC-2 type transport system permease protein